MTTILFIDDDISGINPWVEAARDAGFKCVICTNPTDALDLLRRNRSIELAVVDMMLPRGPFTVDETESGMKTGIALLDAIRKLMGSDYPLITLSILPDQIKALRERGVPFFRKPETDPAALVEEIQNMLSRQ